MLATDVHLARELDCELQPSCSRESSLCSSLSLIFKGGAVTLGTSRDFWRRTTTGRKPLDILKVFKQHFDIFLPAEREREFIEPPESDVY